jgi:PAS domain S-box-containing protein
MRDLKAQLWTSHLVLVVVIAALSVLATVTFHRLGRQVDRILRDNYKSVVATQNMKDALEQMDRAIAFEMGWRAEQAQQQFAEHDLKFRNALNIEAGNITERGEKVLVQTLQTEYPVFAHTAQSLISGASSSDTHKASTAYFSEILPRLQKLKQTVHAIYQLNQTAILSADERARQEAGRATVWSAALAAAALVLAVLFVRFTIRASLQPLRVLASQADEIGKGHLNQRIDLRRSDEIGRLADSFNAMADSLQKSHELDAQRLARAERMSDEAMDSLYDPILVVDAGNRIVHINPAAEALFGAQSALIGQRADIAINIPEINAALELALTSGGVTAEEEPSDFLRIGSGVYRVRVTPIRSDTAPAGAVGVFEDMTQLEAVDRMKSEFIGTASHELKTPVTSLQLATDLLAEERLGPLTPEQRELVEGQKEDLVRLRTTVRDLLDLSRLEAGADTAELSPQPVDDLITSALHGILKSAAAKGVQLSKFTPTRLWVMADRPKLERVLMNLLNNAVRHTGTGGAVTVTCEPMGSMAEITVMDEGSGIPEDYTETIFQPFVQVPGSMQGGTGLGLSIARRMVEAHGGSIWVASTGENGTQFRFTLRLADTAATQGHLPGGDDGTHPDN